MDAGRLCIIKEVNSFIKVEKNGTNDPKHSVGCLCNFIYGICQGDTDLVCKFVSH